ncbi:MAG: 30S ribosomal protein S8e [Candidatus Thalassarchaeaceae archaeon]|jgi:small subunit ribosomal protein S8e|uniref:Small ribosomal subunit protein eS8 n=1 Tax=uncultured Poseidoniia archaeon TaxID=1697135 RepID=A0A1B1TFR9_9ARCH|nr:ribosomal protein s8e (RP-S8e, RPS8) [uncultured Candidatus Thalassoarchaea sp.]|tara:strand:+ start:998 stop:1390 length:393 start_codon:yes stop_codon:yes gene_type:complete
MAKWHGISRRKPSGGRLKRPSRYRGKRKTEISSENQFAFVGDKDARKLYRKTAGSQTVRVLSIKNINVNKPKEGKTVRAKITNVVRNDADTNYVRRNIVTKGAIVETDIGQVRVTSRPGMHGVVSGILLE